MSKPNEPIGPLPESVPSGTDEDLRVTDDSSVLLGLQWEKRNANFLKAYNSAVAAEGVALQEWRLF
jgi:hypothetical protein